MKLEPQMEEEGVSVRLGERAIEGRVNKLRAPA